MAKRSAARRSTALVVRKPRTAKPIVIKTTKIVKAKTKRHHGGGRRHHGGVSLGGFLEGNRVKLALGSAVVGYLEKQSFYAQIPALPVLGKLGTVAIGAFLLSENGRNKMADDVCTAALILAAHEFASTGKVQGYVAGGDGEDEDKDRVGYVAGF